MLKIDAISKILLIDNKTVRLCKTNYCIYESEPCNFGGVVGMCLQYILSLSVYRF